MPGKQWTDGELSAVNDAPLLNYSIPPQYFFSTPDYYEVVKDSMMQLISRYDLSQSDILSIGPGDAQQEYWFYKSGCDLTFIDIDEHGVIVAKLDDITEKSDADDIPPNERTLTYIIGDARRAPEWLRKNFDVLFISSFTPDEFYRSKLLEDAKRESWLPNLLCGSFWLENKAPLSPIMGEFLETGLSKNGLFVLLTYAQGTETSTFFLCAMRDQLREQNIQLLEVYSLVSSPGVCLFIALKGDENDAQQAIKTLGDRSEIDDIHGRSPLSHDAVKIFEYGIEPKLEGNDPLWNLTQNGWEHPKFSSCFANLIDRYHPDFSSTVYAGEPARSEPYWLAREASKIHRSDIHCIESYIVSPGNFQSIPIEIMQNCKTTFYRGPAEEVSAAIGKVSCCYINSYSEDDAWREKINTSFETEANCWPDNELPIHPYIIEIITHCLSPEGWVFLQGRAGGISVPESPSFLAALRLQLSRINIQLLDVYHLIEAPGIFCLAAKRTSAVEAKALSKNNTERVPLVYFYGQAEINNVAAESWTLVE